MQNAPPGMQRVAGLTPGLEPLPELVANLPPQVHVAYAAVARINPAVDGRPRLSRL